MRYVGDSQRHKEGDQSGPSPLPEMPLISAIPPPKADCITHVSLVHSNSLTDIED